MGMKTFKEHLVEAAKKPDEYKETIHDHYQSKSKRPEPSAISREKAIDVITAIDALVKSLDWNKELQSKAKKLKLSAQEIGLKSE